MTSAVATLTIITPAAITLQPVSLNRGRGGQRDLQRSGQRRWPVELPVDFQPDPGAFRCDVEFADSASGTGRECRLYQVRVFNSFSAVTSAVATLTVTARPPSITTQPESLTLSSGATASFAVVAAGTRPLSYQWFFENAAIPGATNASLIISGVQPANAGTYYVVVSNILGSAESEVVTLDVGEDPPSIISQSTSEDVIRGTNLTLVVEAEGSQPLAFQWYMGSEPMVGATNATLVLSDIAYTNSSDYTVTVSNGFGSIESEPILVTVVAAITVTCET